MEKYLQLARDATSSGDRVTAESYFQHAEHYYRMMTANGQSPNGQSPSGQSPNGQGANGHDGNGASRNNQPDEEQAAPGTGPQPDVTAGSPQPDASEDTAADAAPTSHDGDDGQEPASA